MDSKIFEVRSVGGTSNVLAVKLGSDNVAERRILETQGFASGSGLVLLLTLKPHPVHASYDPVRWMTGEGVAADWPMLHVHRELGNDGHSLTPARSST